MSTYSRSLRRSSRNRWVAGVMGGLADYLGLNATILRVLYVIVSMMSAAFPGLLVYLILWIALPKQSWDAEGHYA
jgi:phage shock protein C